MNTVDEAPRERRRFPPFHAAYLSYVAALLTLYQIEKEVASAHANLVGFASYDR